MWNYFFSQPNLFILLIASFAIVLFTRKSLIKKKFKIASFYSALIIVFAVGGISAGSVINEDIKKLEDFKKVEIDLGLENARSIDILSSKEIPIEIHQFSNSSDFEKYINLNQNRTDIMETISIGILLAIIAEIVMQSAVLLQHIFSKVKSKHSK